MVREIVQRGDTTITKINSADNLGDPFTKPLTTKVFEWYVRFDFLHGIIYSPTCQTVVSDPLLWYSGPAPVIAFEEEPEEAVGEPQRLVEWQADNVM
ncbi:hypothetical protein AAC387_Pa07g1918 [Persea americana]